MKITLCDKNLNGDVPTLEYYDKKDAIEIIDIWISTKNLEESVLVCFMNFPAEFHDEFRNEQRSILISHDQLDIYVFIETQFDVDNWHELDFAIFEFDSYKDAFGYCADLKESF